MNMDALLSKRFEIMADEETRIDRLKKELYSRKNEEVIARSRRDLHERDFDAPEEWTPKETKPVITKKLPILKILLVSSIVFFAASAAISSFFLFKTPAFSPQNVEIEIQGPATVGGGEELGLQITIINRNPVPITLVDLIVEYPNGTRAVNDINIELRRYREALGTIDSGDRIRRTVRLVLFGEENSIKDIKVIVEFRVESSNAIFFNEAYYQLALSTSPLSLVVETLKEAISGQDVKFTATITSNSKDVIKNVLLEVEYPFGFEFKSASPKPEFADRLWYLGDIPSEGEKKVEFEGTLVGQDGEERIFRFSIGIQSESDPNRLGVTFINISEALFVKRPFITVDLALDGDTEDNFVARPAGTVRADIFWTNNLPTQIFDGEIEVLFKGDVIDKRTVTADDGFYQSITNSIIWNRQTNPNLSTIPSGQSDQVSFTFTPLGLASGIPFRNPEIEITVSVRGKRLSDAQVPEEIISTLTRKVRVSTNLILTSRGLHFTGPFKNTGPIPPRAEQETTFTIVWTVTNSSNQVEDTQVVATLPSYMRWMGVVVPAREEVSYNSIGGQITWNLGDVSAGVGGATAAREIMFQVSLLPSLSQVGDTPILINEQTITGFDTFTEIITSSRKRALTTRITESGFKTNDGTINP
ncbi:hypothetical protein IID27_01025 [Patescibacteria group bacterium]|nr:hypothetical protein [Patescibacteria group bacterium]